MAARVLLCHHWHTLVQLNTGVSSQNLSSRPAQARFVIRIAAQMSRGLAGFELYQVKGKYYPIFLCMATSRNYEPTPLFFLPADSVLGVNNKLKKEWSSPSFSGLSHSHKRYTRGIQKQMRIPFYLLSLGRQKP